MSKLLITTQVYENYGAHDWDGVGECPSYWKAKGGSDYVVKKINVNKKDLHANSALHLAAQNGQIGVSVLAKHSPGDPCLQTESNFICNL